MLERIPDRDSMGIVLCIEHVLSRCTQTEITFVSGQVLAHDLCLSGELWLVNSILQIGKQPLPDRSQTRVFSLERMGYSSLQHDVYPNCFS